ncbi:methylenetetrahydrofolate reductase [NAD(P)H] [Propionicimonas sp.]|uniref:methylenetetrahydrofolate reductase [NAD(P)H] n=1 Tax=Propionicimonas sp. TaxID=1955623 RepID=UPI0017954143|nr:methylenetetrahydrofolate reductase [NAD(P)H] [Propionicimonas sp.]MBU3976928.1 methylenetetrahydrofolate reductase [NAD(P)H] [Actinomycetota bacterium]MBA3020499.1 methylenetetrahydrofolate reductase [NAD(P)H] [Propionicimonas sp.]MBU3986673.1 methylenetetrahydrofolate reductase [NAD(P)H] [Actinomycetota bacterium]MBU4007175.1 methylenetetrahydrofolate reductase [NAD(P)H] [Actinomycetota bacterium]MBU4064928.1 methylenetetrahydrofolate reductase [NAD(P)H] [Actinomycetota bacterium]
MSDAPATVADLLNNAESATMSFEFFPPKDDAGTTQLLAAIEALQPLRPDFVSVTYGATGSSRERTIDATLLISERTDAITMGHLTCVSQSVEELRGALGAYADAGVGHILAVRGDPPGGPTAAWERHPDGLENATELVRLVKQAGDFCVGVAAFPDGHPEQHDFDLDARILAEKEQAGAEFAITQLFFDPAAYFRLIERVRALGCELPIIAGIMPVTNISQIERFATFSGADLPAAVVARLRAVADDPDAVREVGTEIAVELCDTLLAGGAPGLQFFTQNRSKATAQILEQLRQIPPHSAS